VEPVIDRLKTLEHEGFRFRMVQKGWQGDRWLHADDVQEFLEHYQLKIAAYYAKEAEKQRAAHQESMENMQRAMAAFERQARESAGGQLKIMRERFAEVLQQLRGLLNSAAWAARVIPGFENMLRDSDDLCIACGEEKD